MDIRGKKLPKSLAVSLACLWGLSAILWFGHAAPLAAALVPIAPPLIGIDMMLTGNAEIGIISLLISILEFTSITLVCLRPNRILLVVAHVINVLYWFWGNALIGIGV